MKKIAAILLALTLLAVSCFALGEEGAAAEAAGEKEAPVYSYDEITVGNPTALKGDFFTDLWGNTTSDLDVRALIHGYDLVRWDGENGLFVHDPTVVNGIIVQDNEAGDRTYYLNLYTDLYYSDGAEITAYDYAFTYLLTMDPVIEKLGGKPLRREHILGYEEYAKGESKALAGVRVINERRLAVTVRHEYLPFFYELGLLDCMPYPMHVIAPGCQVKDDGEGVYIEGGLDEATLRKTILDPVNGYRSHPAVSCGPYTLTSFDGVTAQFEVNPYFKGDAEGAKPMISRITYTLADNDTMVQKLENAEFGLLNKVTRADAVQSGAALTAGGYYATSNYPRTGLTFISFNCEKPTVQSQAVRQAIASCLDKDQLVADYVGAFGLRMDGYYGMGQWMYQILSGAVAYPVTQPEEGDQEGLQAYESALAAWEGLTLDSIPAYSLNVEEAVRLLEADGWTLNRQGQPFQAGKDDVRCKQVNGSLTALDLTLSYPAGNKIVESMEKNLTPYLNQAGIALSFDAQETPKLLDMFYQRTERQADMLYLGTDFDVVFDPSAHFVPGKDGELSWNYTEAADETLYQLAVDMRMTQPGDTLTYCQRWIEFQKQFAQLEPMIPIYSNVYFDFYPRVLHDYNVGENVTWTQAIVKAYLSDAEDEAEESAADAQAPGDGEMIFN